MLTQVFNFINNILIWLHIKKKPVKVTIKDSQGEVIKKSIKEPTGPDAKIKNKTINLKVRTDNYASEFSTAYEHRRELYREFAKYRRYSEKIKNNEINKDGVIWTIASRQKITSFRFSDITIVTLYWD
jgi:hypothetical protein